MEGGGGGRPIAERQNLAYFRGKILFHGDRTRPTYSRGIRALLNSSFGPTSQIVIAEGHSPTYLDELNDSKLCIAPPGHALWSPRLAESILVGCVPLVIGDDIELPFEWVVDYRSIAVRVAEADVPRLDKIIAGVPNSVLESKRRRLQHIWKRFV